MPIGSITSLAGSLAGRGALGRPPGAGPLGLGVPRAPRALDREDLDALVEVGRRNAGGRWSTTADLAHARNKHATNRVGELRDALAGDYDWLEVDVRTIAGEVVATHDRIPARDSLLVRDWIEVGAATGRGLKLDFKERDSIAPTLALVARAGVPDERLVINVPVLGRGGIGTDALQRIRRRFPRATINLSLVGGRWDTASARAAVDLARTVGGPVAFPVELGRVDAELVAALRRGGRVAVWNDPRRSPAPDAGATRARLRRIGVDGTIDLR
jgi:hypothetical protein